MPPAAPPSPPSPPPPTTTPPEAAPATTMASPPPSVSPPPEAPTKEREHTTAPWVVAGAGLVAIGIGIPLAILGANEVSKAERTIVAEGCSLEKLACSGLTPDQQAAFVDKYNSDKNAGLGLEYTGIVLVGVGAAAMIGGVVWHFAEPTGPASRAHLQPVVRPGFAGLSLGGAF